MNSGFNWLVAITMAVVLSACATGGSSPADTASGMSAPAADSQPSSKSIISAEPECD